MQSILPMYSQYDTENTRLLNASYSDPPSSGTMTVMTRKLGKDSKMQKADNVRIMHQNVLLIKEVNDLRHDLKMARGDTHDLEVIMGFNSKNRPPDIIGGESIYL